MKKPDMHMVSISKPFIAVGKVSKPVIESAQFNTDLTQLDPN